MPDRNEEGRLKGCLFSEPEKEIKGKNMGKQLIFDILNHKRVERPAWVPFAGIHAGKLIGATAVEVLTQEDKLYEALLQVNRLYRPDGQPVMFDLQIEAEILGCGLQWAEDTPPTVREHPYAEARLIPCRCKMPTKDSGRLPMILRTMERLKRSIGETTALYGLVCGPFTLASHLRGTEIFMDMFDEPEYVQKLIDYCAEFIVREAELYIGAGMDVIAVVDPLVSQISSDHFGEFLSEPYTKIFAQIRKAGAYTSFFVCGDATRNVESMCQTGPDCISVDENICISGIRPVTEKYNVAVGGNIPLTTVMLHGSQQDNMKYTVELLEGIEDRNHNLIVSPGCDMPYDVPVENAIGVAQAVLEFDKVKELVKNYEATDYSKFDIVIPDYAHLKKPLLEVFTIDSSSCAACTYMMGTANAAKEKYGDRIDVVEYKFTVRENIARVMKMGIKQLPCMLINGELKYSSIIPGLDELSKEIEAKLK